MSAPLTGVRVVALEQAIAMPYCTFILAEMGADVVKIERPGRGDVVRGWDSAVHGLSTGFVWVNAGKRDIAIDLGGDEGQEVARRLAERADVFCENFAPGVAARLGLGSDRLGEANPRLVYCSLSGYGQSGPYRDRKAYDLLIQGEAGLIATTGSPQEPAKVGVPVADLIAGTNAALAVALALRERDRTGEGAVLDVSMFDGVLSWLGYYPQHYWHGGGEPARTGMRHQYLCPYGPFRAGDGRDVILVVAGDQDWMVFCREVVRRPDLESDPRYATTAARTQHREELDRLVEELIAAEPSEVWEGRLAAAGLAFGRVRGIAEVLEHPEVEARRMVVEATSGVGELPVVRFPLADAGRPRRIPALGEHTDAVLREAGYGESEIDRLRTEGVIA